MGLRRVAAIALGALALAGCGGGGALSIDPVAQAAEKTQRVSSARFTLDMTVVDEDGKIHFRGPGVLADHGRVLQMQAAMDATKDTPAMRMQMIVDAHDAIYLKSPEFAQVLPRGVEWIVASDKTPSAAPTDPGQWLAYIRASGDVEERGSDTIDGAHVTHYAANVDLDKGVKFVKPKDRARAEAMVGMAKRAGINSVPFDVWVDDQGLVRRIAMNWHPDDAGALELTMTLSHFNAPVHVAIPPRSQTITYAKFMQRVKQMGGG